ncbi:MAG: TolC family protein [Owenweeksia sp.]|nr:TolC family protein [Owenweeksia sp.]
MMNRSLQEDFAPVDSIVLTNSLQLNEILEGARTQNAQLNQQQLMEIVASEEVAMERGSLLPEIELFGNYNYNREQHEVGFLQASRSFGPNFGVRVRFNLYQGGQDQTALQNAKITAATEELRSQKVGQDIEAAVRIAFLRWQNEMKQVRLESKSAAKAQQTLQIAGEQYEAARYKGCGFPGNSTQCPARQGPAATSPLPR